MPRPNILWIVTTQWRAQALGYAGDPNARTPCLDALAAESVNYTQAVTPHPFGPFARAAMLTGVRSPANGVIDYFDPLPPAARTVAHALADRGYATAFFGKWHLAPRERGAALVGDVHAKTLVPPEHRGGFDFWEGFESGFLLNDPWLHGTRLPTPQRFEGYQSDVLCARAAEWMAERSLANRASWFAVVSLEAPHPPYDAPAAGIRSRDPREITLPKNVPAGDAALRAVRELSGYYAQTEATDRAIGRLLGTVRRHDTAVVFTSVHGDMHGAHGLFRKGWPHEESIRVPLLVRRPGIAPASRTDVMSLVDLPELATAWADGSAEGPVRQHAAISMPSVVPFPLQCERAWRGVRSQTRKLILNADGSPWLFYNLERDPLEMTNLAYDPAAQRELEATWRQFLPIGFG